MSAFQKALAGSGTPTFASATFAWVRSDRPREDALAYWRGPHAQIVARNPAFKEYRQHHFSRENAGLWPRVAGVETEIPQDRKIDGMPEVTFRNALAILASVPQNRLIQRDEANVFSRTILHVTAPRGGCWFHSDEYAKVGARCVILLRRRPGTPGKAFSHFIGGGLGPALARHAEVLELRSLVFLPWIRMLWDSPGVAHDYPNSLRFNAAIVLGAATEDAIKQILGSDAASSSVDLQSQYCSAIHAYSVANTYRFVLPAR